MWDIDQPDNWGNGEDCAEMRANGMWNDIPCMDYERPYICERLNGMIICRNHAMENMAQIMRSKQ